MRTRGFTIAFICAIALVAAAIAFGTHLKRKAALTKVISHAHLVAKLLQIYVKDNNGLFPQTLEALTKDPAIDSRFLKPPFGATVSYVRPPPLASDHTEVLVISYRKQRIVITKDFERVLAKN
jgi:hypothetical protein